MLKLGGFLTCGTPTPGVGWDEVMSRWHVYPKSESPQPYVEILTRGLNLIESFLKLESYAQAPINYTCLLAHRQRRTPKW